MREQDIIRRLCEAFTNWGIGDDAAVLPAPDGELLLASDAVVEGVHFSRAYGTLGQAVQKVITSNVSDIYSMGGEPRSILMTAGLPGGCGEDDIESIISGVSLACDAYGVELVGGDTVRSPAGYFFDVAIAGSVVRGRALRRSGALPGDSVVLFGTCGGSLAGLMILEALSVGSVGHSPNEAVVRRRDMMHGAAALIEGLVPADRRTRGLMMEIIPSLTLSMTADDIEGICGEHGLGQGAVSIVECAGRHLVPRARPLDRALLAGHPDVSDSRAGDRSHHDAPTETGGEPYVAAMIDVSDGLARDLTTMCAESGVGAIMAEKLLPIHPALERTIGPEGAGRSGEDGSGGRSSSHSWSGLTELILASGEEYVMLAAVRGLAEGAECPGGSVIGRIVGPDQGTTIVARDGVRRPLPALGYEHVF